jgi:hypothetical protein
MTLVLIFVANFSLPDEEGTPFQEILYVELAKDEAKEVVDLYNKVSLYYLFFFKCCGAENISFRLRGDLNPNYGSRSSSYLNKCQISIK